MNVYDSEQMVNLLASLGYIPVTSMDRADLIIVNTCAIREKAEQKVFSFLGRLVKLKRKKANLIIAVAGCVAQQEGQKILDRMPHVDLVFGTHAVGRLPRMIQRIAAGDGPIVDIDMSNTITAGILNEHSTESSPGVSRFVTIMQGCDNFCSYCVVPYVRGRELSRAPADIIREIKHLVACGAREVTLLGQNVNSYGKKEHLCSFPELLEQVCRIEGISRVRFTTSHPKDLSNELMHAFKDLDVLCRHIHLPVQSGSNRVLKLMNRKYTRESYLEKVDTLRQLCPEIALSSDFIVGFPGEAPEDFQQTLDLIQTVEYDSLFAFKYSDRPNVPAADFPDKISEAEKTERLQTLLKAQEYYTGSKHQTLVGTTCRVLVEGLSKRKTETVGIEEVPNAQWSGRTSSNKIVNFSVDEHACLAGDDLTGRMMDIKIEKAFSHSLWGRPVDGKTDLSDAEGENRYHAA